mmetsp:Transcript_36557/g.116381  ORF Transcript_36557/g.116381 Transcript_36557/m.116381 type:complete len:283 (-) Transcript_36557:896-1744(-)
MWRRGAASEGVLLSAWTESTLSSMTGAWVMRRSNRIAHSATRCDGHAAKGDGPLSSLQRARNSAEKSTLNPPSWTFSGCRPPLAWTSRPWGNVFRASLTIRRLRRHSVFSTRFSSCWPRNTEMRRQKTAKTVSAVVPWAFHSSSRPLHGLTGIPVAAPTWPRETRGRAGSMATSCGRHSRWGPPGERSARTGCRRGWKGPARRVASAGPVPSSRARCETSCAACRRGRRQTQSWRPSSTGGWTGTAMRTAARWHGRWSNPTGARPPTSCWRGWMGWRTRCRP